MALAFDDQRGGIKRFYRHCALQNASSCTVHVPRKLLLVQVPRYYRARPREVRGVRVATTGGTMGTYVAAFEFMKTSFTAF